MTASLSPAARDSWQLLAQRIQSETDSRLRANLEVVARHVAAEVVGDMPTLMATMVPQPRYRVWGASASRGPQGYDEVEQFYLDSIAIGKNRLEFHVSRVMVDRDTVLTEGVFRHAYDGATIIARGFAGADGIEPTGWYLVEYQALILWPISAEGLIEGEDLYAGEKPRLLRALQSGEFDHLGPVNRSSDQ